MLPPGLPRRSQKNAFHNLNEKFGQSFLNCRVSQFAAGYSFEQYGKNVDIADAVSVLRSFFNA